MLRGLNSPSIRCDLQKRYSFWQQTEEFVINLNALNKKESASFEKEELAKFRNFEKYLSRSFCQLDHVGKEIPIKWLDVREALLEEKENWISVERFNNICIQKEIGDRAQRTSLLNCTFITIKNMATAMKRIRNRLLRHKQK